MPRHVSSIGACLVLLCVLTLLPHTANAEDAWSYHTRAGEWAFAHGGHERAEAEFGKALEIAQGFPAGDRRLETSLENLARFYEHRSKLDRAQPLFELLLAAREARLGEQHPALLDALLATGRVALGAGDVPSAEANLDRFLALAEATGAADPEQLWRVLTMRARMRVLADDGETALGLQRRAVQAIANDRAATDEERAAEMEGLAGLELIHGSADEAERLISTAIDLRRAADPNVSAAHLLAAGARQAFANGHLDVAERLASRATADAGDQPLMDAVATLADVLWMRVQRGTSEIAILLEVAEDTAERVEAEGRLHALYDARVTRLGPADPATIETAGRLAMVAAMRGHADAAARWLRVVVGAHPGKVKARNDLVDLLVAAGSTEEAIAEGAALVELIESTAGADSVRLVPVLTRQMELLTDARRKKEAKAIKRRLRKLGR